MQNHKIPVQSTDELHKWFELTVNINIRDGSRFSNIRLVNLIIEYQIGCAIIF